jgi:hypothetical protein
VTPTERHPRNSLLHPSGVARRARSGAVPGIFAPSSGRGRPAALLALLALGLLTLTLAHNAASAAAAAPNFCPPGQSASQCNDPSGVAVDQSIGEPSSGDVYVADSNNSRIDKFDSAGNFLLAFGWGVRNGAAELQACTTATGCEQGTFGSRAGQLYLPPGVAVDNSPGGAGDLYVSDANNSRIQKFSPSGAFLLMFGKGVNTGTSGNPDLCTNAGPPTNVCGAGSHGAGAAQFGGERLPVAVDSFGNVWVGDVNRLEQFSPAGAFLSELKLPGAGEISALAVDSAGDFYTLKPQIPGTNERQEITPPASGTYTLTFEGQTTAPIPFDAPTSPADCPSAEPSCLSIQSALEALSTIGSGNVRGATVSRTVTFVGALADTDVPQMTASAGATVETTAQGKAETPGVLSKLKPSGELLYTLDSSAPYGHPNALALDPATGDLFVSDQIEPGYGENQQPATLLEFDSSGAQLEAFGAGGEVIGHPQGNALAFGDAAQRLYLASSASYENSAAQIFALPEAGPLPETGSRAAPIHKVSATLCAKVNPEDKETTVHFQYITAAKFKEDGNSFGAGTEVTAESASIGADFSAHEACQTVSPLVPATAYRFRVVAHNENAPLAGIDGETAEFTTLPPAAIDSTSASDVTAESATLQAQINPLGDATSYRFEYLTEAEYLKNQEEAQPPFTGAAQAPIADAPLGAGVADVSVSQHLQNLQPHTVYRYRVLAVNSIAPAGFPGPTLAFTTQAAGGVTVGSVLPDHRAWELVSPPDKRGAQIMPIGGWVSQASASGDAIVFTANAPTESEPQGNTGFIQVLSTRGGVGSSSWSSRDLPVPHAEATGKPPAEEYVFFSNDLSLGLLQPEGAFEPALSPEASQQTPYLRTDFPPGDPTEPCTQSCYRPLVTAANTPEGAEFGKDRECDAGPRTPPGTPIQVCGPLFGGANPDFSHLVLESFVALTSAPLPAKGLGLYEWSAAAPPAESLRLLSVLPGPGAEAASGGPSLGSFVGSSVTRDAISSDGSRVVWSNRSNGGYHSHLYLRYNATEAQSPLGGAGECTAPALACTLQLDAVQGGSGGGSASTEPRFQLASADASRVFFTDEQRLTAGSGAGAGEADLYECRIEEVAGQLRCDLTDLTPESSGEPARVRAYVLGASADGSFLYFAADGVLTGEEENEHGEKARAGQPNLYLRHEGTTTLVAVLSAADRGDLPTGVDGLYRLTARVAPHGRWLAFMSQRPLTGYDNRDAASGKPDEEVYLYGEGKLVCASCNPTGARPRGVEVTHFGVRLVDENQAWEPGDWLAANVPRWTSSTTDLYQSRYLSDSGRLFFNSSDALVPRDTNGTEDVYQYEPPSIGSCTAASPTYSPASGGCVDLISSGTSKEESAFLDASESGNDVFFLTRSQLSHRDTDTAIDVYDARVGGGEVEPPPPPSCEGDACQSPVAAPEDPTPGSLTFQGPGNLVPSVSTPTVKPKSLTRAQKLASALKACGKKPKRKRPACKKQARRAYGPAGKAKKSNRRAK